MATMLLLLCPAFPHRKGERMISLKFIAQGSYPITPCQQPSGLNTQHVIRGISCGRFSSLFKTPLPGALSSA